MLVTRPEPDASRTVARLRALDIAAIAVPMLVRQPLAPDLPDPESFAAMVVTSANALRTLAEANAIARYRHLPLFTVGGKTAGVAAELGFADITSAAGDLATLVEVLAGAGLTGPVFYPAAEQVAGDLQQMLAPSNIGIVTTPIYRMVPVHQMPPAAVAAIKGGQIDAALFYSRRTALGFIAALADQLSAPQRAALPALSLSAAVAEPLVQAGYGQGGVAAQPEEETMMSLALAFARARNAP